jgi:8-oxo-dGTP pyrophosphatase MutT (NUDIX family)
MASPSTTILTMNPNPLGIRERLVARVVLIDDDNRVLLFDTQLAYTRVWMTPGGGVKPGEKPEEAALRELWEETGVVGLPLSRCIWKVRFRFQYEQVIYEQNESYFAVRCPRLEIDGANREHAEFSEILEHRWWNLAEITRSPASFRPNELAALLPSVLAGDYPDIPIRAQVEPCARQWG